ncbi:Gag-pol Polyprotein [Phytophthora megakarya]|uniref:Gag-pol Polyprotein n=1 Tax=Phytophthora megakarya TaxID=4795 RepID=A0A225UP54_9STRA|nr:Gag-pol Polyprotein [Phytophthora megakarya]
MADKSLVDGMMLKGRELSMCETCQLAKQKRKKHLKSLDRDIREPNDRIFVDLMDPGKNNSTKFTQILVIVDGFSRFIRVFPITEKPETNETLKQYIAWAKRQLGRPVKSVYLDGGPEFVNTAMEECAGT